MRVTASAPGKLVLLGEYAVLEGAPALVLAVDRRARVTLTAIARDAWEVVSPTLGLAARLRFAAGAGIAWEGTPPAELAWLEPLFLHLPRATELPACRLDLDSDRFYIDHAGAREKLGLGSSAALAVALLGALHAAAGLDLPALPECVRAHRAIQHDCGSGIDVAASRRGGLSRFTLSGESADCLPMRLPDGLHWRCIYSGRPASTGAMLARVAAWRAREPAEYARRMSGLATISSRGVDAVAANDAAALLSAISQYSKALARFGEAAGVDIVSRDHRAIASIAGAEGCVYKSCGAGGGDVGVTFAVEDTRLREASAQVARAGFPVVALEADRQGLEVAATV